MNVTATIDRLKPAIQEMVRLTLTDIDHLSASNIALTMLALLRYQGNRPSRNLERLLEKLIQKQLPNGSWNNELWATGLALLAQHRLLEHQGKRLDFRSGFVRNAIGYIESTANERRWNWQGEFFETILLCWLLVVIGYRRETRFLGKAIERLKELQAENGRLFDVYDTALALLAFDAGAKALQMDNATALERGVRWLKQWPPEGETIWSRAVTLFAIAELQLAEADWAESIVKSLLSQFQGGLVSDDHDEQAMVILALCDYLSVWFPEQLALQRIPIDNLVRLFQYDEFLHSSRTSINAKLEAANVGVGSGERMFTYTDAFVKYKDDLYHPLETADQLRATLSAFYMLFYEGSGTAKRIPAELLAEESIIFKIKHLRTSVQHDVQHGADVEKKERVIEAVYRDACGRARPSDRDDYRLVQVYLLSEIERFLVDVSQYVTAKSIKDK